MGVQRKAVCKLPLNPEGIYWDVIGLELTFSSLPEERGCFVDNRGGRCDLRGPIPEPRSW